MTGPRVGGDIHRRQVNTIGPLLLRTRSKVIRLDLLTMDIVDTLAKLLWNNSMLIMMVCFLVYKHWTNKQPFPGKQRANPISCNPVFVQV
jgi:hypothetical protein